MRITHDASTLAKAGPYSHAAEIDGNVHLSGQTPFDPMTGSLLVGDVDAQTGQCLDNLWAVLAAADLDERDVLKVNVYLTDMADFAAMNRVYATRWSEPFPARTTIAVTGLPLGARVEIDAVARRSPTKHRS